MFPCRCFRGVFLGISERGGEAQRCPGTSLPTPLPEAHRPTPGICSLGHPASVLCSPSSENRTSALYPVPRVPTFTNPRVMPDWTQALTRAGRPPGRGPQRRHTGPSRAPTPRLPRHVVSRMCSHSYSPAHRAAAVSGDSAPSRAASRVPWPPAHPLTESWLLPARPVGGALTLRAGASHEPVSVLGDTCP